MESREKQAWRSCESLSEWRNCYKRETSEESEAVRKFS